MVFNISPLTFFYRSLLSLLSYWSGYQLHMTRCLVSLTFFFSTAGPQVVITVYEVSIPYTPLTLSNIFAPKPVKPYQLSTLNMKQRSESNESSVNSVYNVNCIRDSCYCSIKLNPMEGRFSK